MRWIYNLLSMATGLGITNNIIDCYAAIIRLTSGPFVHEAINKLPQVV